MSIAEIHGYVLGIASIATWATIMFWALGLRVADPEEAPMFWRVVAVAQAVIGIQALYGMFLLARWIMGTGGLPAATNFDSFFHVLYGAVFPLIVLVVGHRFARGGRYSAYSTFAVVGLVNFGLVTRAYQVACTWPAGMCH